MKLASWVIRNSNDKYWYSLGGTWSDYYSATKYRLWISAFVVAWFTKEPCKIAKARYIEI